MFQNDVHESVIENNIKNKDSEDKIIKGDYVNSGSQLGTILSIAPTLLLLGGMAFFLFFTYRRMNSMGGSDKIMGFGKAKIKNPGQDGRKTTFSDVAGADEEKEELSEIVEFLKSPQKFKELGARIPKGVLLVGPPGTG